jgi:hypothetical protein
LSDKQIAILQRNGVDPALVKNRGHASVILSGLFAFRDRESATDRQKRFCSFLGHPNPWQLTKAEANRK